MRLVLNGASIYVQGRRLGCPRKKTRRAPDSANVVKVVVMHGAAERTVALIHIRPDGHVSMRSAPVGGDAYVRKPLNRLGAASVP